MNGLSTRILLLRSDVGLRDAVILRRRITQFVTVHAPERFSDSTLDVIADALIDRYFERQQMGAKP